MILHSQVEKILFAEDDDDDEIPKAVGVTFRRFSLPGIKVFANKEVILSAGAVNSPQVPRQDKLLLPASSNRSWHFFDS